MASFEPHTYKMIELDLRIQRMVGMIGLENNSQGKITLTATLYSKENKNAFALSIVGRTMKQQDSETLE